MRYTFSFLLVLLAVPALAQTPEASGEVGALTGRMTDAETGEALIGANIHLTTTTLGAATSIEGDYMLIDVPEGFYRVAVSQTGFYTAEFDSVQVERGQTLHFDAALTRDTTTVFERSIATGETWPGVRVIMGEDLAEPEVSARGDLVGEVVELGTGDPLIGVSVYLVGTTRGAATDVDGRFVVRDVPAGVYTVEVSYVGFGRVKIAGVIVEPESEAPLGRVAMVEDYTVLGCPMACYSQNDQFFDPFRSVRLAASRVSYCDPTPSALEVVAFGR